ncbi:MAG TPA: hypothetical protein VGL71_05495, partial [Urbifossiella sp.]
KRSAQNARPADHDRYLALEIEQLVEVGRHGESGEGRGARGVGDRKGYRGFKFGWVSGSFAIYAPE